MGDTLEKANFNDPLMISALTFNVFVAAAKAIVKKPMAEYLEKVYDKGDFGLLGIGA